MKNAAAVFMTTLLLTACQINNPGDNKKITHEEIQILFFSNEDQIYQEESYYDALLDIKKKFPKIMEQIEVIDAKNKTEEYKHYNVKTYPALLVIKNQQVIIRLEGQVSRTAILDVFEKFYKQ